MTPENATTNIDNEVVKITQELIQIDSTNFGDDTGPGEAAVAEYVDWFKPVRGGESKDLARAERIVTGDSYLKNRAHELLLSI